MLLNQAASVTLHPLYDSYEAAYITAGGNSVSNILNPSPTLFYILENRQQKGWDTYIPGHGLLITKISYHSAWWTGNIVNNNSSDMGVDIQEADGLSPSYSGSNRSNGYFGKQGDAYPTSTVTSFTAVSDYPVTDIMENNGIITFRVKGGGEDTPLEAVSVQHSGSTVRKILRDGQIFIIRNNNTYDLTGRQL